MRPEQTSLTTFATWREPPRLFRRATVPLALGVVAVCVGGCGDHAQPPNDRPVTAVPTVTSTAMTRTVPPRLLRVCASAARKGTVRVRCPRLIPADPGGSSVLLPRRSVVRPGAAGDDGVRRIRGPRDFYVIEAYSRALRPEGHWLTGSGNTRSLEQRALISGRRPRVERRRVGGRVVELRRYPPYPDGGVNGGHVVAVWTVGATTTYVSVHGQGHADVAVAMLLDLLRPAPGAPD